MRRIRREVWVVLCALCALFIAGTAHAHNVKPAVLALQEVAPGRFLVNWSAPAQLAPGEKGAVPHFPAHCSVVAGESQTFSAVDCGEQGLTGAISFEPDARLVDGVNVHITWLGGGTQFVVARGYPLRLELNALPASIDFEQRLALVVQYVKLGVEHILLGLDHVLFVLGLMLIVRARRALLWTITAFTLAHSITLAAASLELAKVPSAPVELCIALSVLLLAFEASDTRPSWLRRWPWAVAFSFGLLHGLGFASALSGVGLPHGHILTSLLAFNLGVEIGQLCVMAGAAAFWFALVRTPRLGRRAEFIAVLALGAAATFWTLQRAEALLFPGLGS
jgi:hydrogenase/urease accessory protein HupE